MYFKRGLRALLLFLSFAVFSGVSRASMHLNKVDQDPCGHSAFTKKITGDVQGNYLTFRKKYRTKGIEVDVPQIVSSPLDSTLHFKEFSIFYSKVYFSSENYSYHLQRGPPLS